MPKPILNLHESKTVKALNNHIQEAEHSLDDALQAADQESQIYLIKRIGELTSIRNSILTDPASRER